MSSPGKVVDLHGIAVDIDQLVSLRSAAQHLRLLRNDKKNSGRAGEYRSRWSARGMEFAESRVYIPGDDVRSIDWRITARRGEIFTKVFQEEREKPLILVADFSSSMYFGTRRVFKSVLAAELCALLAWNGLKRGDRIGGLIFSEAGHRELRPGGGHRNVLKLLQLLADYSVGKDRVESFSTDALESVLQRLRRVGKPGSSIILASDFYHLDREVERHLSRLTRHCRVILCHVFDPLEKACPTFGQYPISSGRQTAVLDCSDPSVRKHFARHFDKRWQFLDRMSRQYGMGLLHFSTDVSAAETLGRAGPRAGLSF